MDVLGFKMYLFPTQFIDGILCFASHLYDKKEIEFIIKIFPTDGVLIGGGTYKGFWSLRFASIYPNAKIFTVEPNPEIFEVFQFNIKINHPKYRSL